MPAPAGPTPPDGLPLAVPGANPFLAYRHQLDVYRRAMATGIGDTSYCRLVTESDDRVAAIDGAGFRPTPLVELRPDGGGLPVEGWPDGPVVAKVETGNVAGSHKARHLFGLLLGLLIDEVADDHRGDGGSRPELVIASCGNAALGAAVVAASAGRTLRVFVPVDADPRVRGRLAELGARVEVCPRRAGEPGDPCVHALDRAVAGGARPFTVQGPRCPEVIDGARTLGLELADQLDAGGITATDLYVQIGGGGLATAVMDGLERARPGRRPPRLHPVQAASAHPYVAAARAVLRAVTADLGLPDPGDDRSRADAVAGRCRRDELLAAIERRSDLVRPWPDVPVSVASGILDDEAYDWRTVLGHQILSGGWPVLVDEDTLIRASRLAATLVSPPPDATGAAGLAGLLADDRRPPVVDDGAAVVLLTGIDRSTADP